MIIKIVNPFDGFQKTKFFQSIMKQNLKLQIMIVIAISYLSFSSEIPQTIGWQDQIYHNFESCFICGPKIGRRKSHSSNTFFLFPLSAMILTTCYHLFLTPRNKMEFIEMENEIKALLTSFSDLQTRKFIFIKTRFDYLPPKQNKFIMS